MKTVASFALAALASICPFANAASADNGAVALPAVQAPVDPSNPNAPGVWDQRTSQTRQITVLQDMGPPGGGGDKGYIIDWKSGITDGTSNTLMIGEQLPSQGSDGRAGVGFLRSTDSGKSFYGDGSVRFLSDGISLNPPSPNKGSSLNSLMGVTSLNQVAGSAPGKDPGVTLPAVQTTGGGGFKGCEAAACTNNLNTGAPAAKTVPMEQMSLNYGKVEAGPGAGPHVKALDGRTGTAAQYGNSKSFQSISPGATRAQSK